LITVRGIEDGETFRDDADLDNFRDRLARIVLDTGTSCFAWALMPNHAHLLLRTGDGSIAMVMRRLLTGYALTHNRRHGRHGPVFLDRYHSLLCQEEPYLLELVRHVHLNPLRAGVVPDPERLETYAYAGHGALAGRLDCPWQDVRSVLARFGEPPEAARKAYVVYVREGVARGRRPAPAGGGPTPGAAGREPVSEGRRDDQRILGDPDFVRRILGAAGEQARFPGTPVVAEVDLGRLAERAAEVFGVTPEEIFHPGKYRRTVQARSLFCYWAVRKLGYTATGLAGRLGLTQPAVSVSVRRGQKLAGERGLEMGFPLPSSWSRSR
jgi:REP element-mobilizing transposase RayT